MRTAFAARIAAGFVALLLLGAVQALAAPSSAVQVPQGAQVQVKGSTMSLMRQNGTTGTYNCSCAATKGACLIKQSPGVVQCESSTANPCSNCEMETTTNRKGAAAAARAAAHGGAVSHTLAP